MREKCIGKNHFIEKSKGNWVINNQNDKEIIT